jgi:hypothetical protein
MTIERQIYETSTLLGVVAKVEPPSDYWLNLCFPGTITFTDEWIDFGQIEGHRKIAPLVVPTAQGKPIYSQAERSSRVKPAYLKPKDPVSDSRMIRRQAGLGELLQQRPLTPAQRYAAIIADIQLQHRDSILRRWEWMAAQAILNGAVVLEDDGYPRAVVDFERDPSLTIVLGAGARWGEAGVSILDSVEGFRKLVRDAKFGGPTNRLTIGSDVWEIMRRDPEIRDLLKAEFRPNNNGLNLNLGIREGLEVEYVGTLSGTLQVYVYSDYYQDKTGATVPFMDPRDIVLTGPNVQGVKAFGAILDKKAGFQALPIFPKMWDSEDPSATFIMTQSAPLMIPTNTNNTLRARVIA